MKRQFLLLAGSVVLLSSCGTNNKPSHDEVFIDSVANVNVAKHDAENARKNDSIINEEARKKAAAMQAGQVQVIKKEEEPQPASTPTIVPAPKQVPNPAQH